MGIDKNVFNFLKFCTKNSLGLGKILTLGRQGNHISWINPDTGLVDKFCEPMLINEFKASNVLSLDASDFENATFIQDLNKKWDAEGLANQKFTTILDAGTLEHVFNVPQALDQMARACEVGGQIIHIQNHSDFCGHGFWQFSAELFQSWYSKENGFTNLEIFIAPLTNQSVWFRCLKPKNGERDELSGRGVPRSYILVKAEKVEDRDCYNCYQSDYVTSWEKNDPEQIFTSKQSLLFKIRRLIPLKTRILILEILYKLTILKWWKSKYLVRENIKDLLSIK